MARFLWLLFVALSVLGCARKIDEIADPSDVSVKVSAEMEKSFVEGREARQWLAEPGNSLFEMGNSAGREWTERLYTAGATIVKVCDAEQIAEGRSGQISATLAVGLPEDNAKRKTVLDVFNDLARATDNEPSRDVGQKFEMIDID